MEIVSNAQAAFYGRPVYELCNLKIRHWKTAELVAGLFIYLIIVIYKCSVMNVCVLLNMYFNFLTLEGARPERFFRMASVFLNKNTHHENTV